MIERTTCAPFRHGAALAHRAEGRYDMKSATETGLVRELKNRRARSCPSRLRFGVGVVWKVDDVFLAWQIVRRCGCCGMAIAVGEGGVDS